MNFREVVTNLSRTANVRHAQAALRAAYGKGATRWIAEQAGVSPRTARRWMSATPPAGRVAVIIALLAGEAIAAQRIRHAAGISVGTVAVAYDERDEGSRFIGDLDVDTYMAQELEAAANALEEGNWDAAADAFSDAVIAGYSDGLQDTLSVWDYGDGVVLSE
jgi:hypothetical protein